MSQSLYDIIEIIALSIGCAISLATWIYVNRYTRSTNSIAQFAHETALEAAETAKITEEEAEISSKTLEEMRETRDSQTAPYVFVYFDQVEGEDSTKIFLVVKNAGGGQARDVRITFDPELRNGGTYSLEHIRQLTGHIPSLPPGGEIRHAFALTVDYFNAQSPLPTKYRARVSFHGGVKTDVRVVKQVLSLDPFVGLRINRVEARAR
jgi:hypothetical protein